MEKQMIVVGINEDLYAFDRQMDIGPSRLCIRKALPRKEREEMALSLASALQVFDEEKGVVYEGYNADLLETLFVLRHYTDIDVSPFDTADGRYELYDILDSNGVLAPILEYVDEDFQKVKAIFNRIQDASIATFESAHSLSHMLKTTLGSLLGNEDLAEGIAKAESVNSSMIDMLGALRRENERGKLTDFAKRDIPEPPAE